MKRKRERYTTAAYGMALRKACNRYSLERWHPNQIRHAFATAVRKGHGLDVAQALLGHDRVSTTEVYAERADDVAAAVAASIG